MAASPNRRRFDEQELLDAARTVFYRDGYGAAQTADIAALAGTSRVTLHSRFGSKEDLYLRVVGREAEVLGAWISAAYSDGRTATLPKLAEIGMEPIFRLASDRPDGFHLLFRGDTHGERPSTARRELLAQVTGQLTELIEARQSASGPALGPHAETLAAACVGVAVHICENAIERGHDLALAHQMATQFVYGAFVNLDFHTLTASRGSGV